jgi:hypothetical protein
VSDKLAEVVEINLTFAKLELRRMDDPSAPARALHHIEEAIKALRAAYHPGNGRRGRSGKKAADVGGVSLGG